MKCIASITPWGFQWIKEPLPCKCAKAVEEQLKAQAGLEAKEKKIMEQKAKEEHKALVKKIFSQSGLSARGRLCTFDNYRKNEDSQEAFDIFYNYAKNFKNIYAKKELNGLFVVGNQGVGKTHLANALAGYLLNEGESVVIKRADTLLNSIKDTYDDNGKVKESEILKLYENVKLLIIDEFGKDIFSSWAAGKIFNIVDSRYENLLPVVIITNYPDYELIKRFVPEEEQTARSIMDRLYETCKPVVLVGKSYRSGGV